MHDATGLATRQVRVSTTVLFYVQHLLGIGHLARASLVAEALAGAGARVTLVTGGRPVAGFPASGIDVVQLPSLAAGPSGFGDLVNEADLTVDEEYKSQRRDLLLKTFHELNPDVLLIEAFPFGRGQMRFELLPLLDAARQRPQPPLVATSVRDILQHRAAHKLQRTVDEINAWFDKVLVHGDPGFARLDETFEPVAGIADKIRYTGIVSAVPGELDGDPYDVVVSAGGGAAGEGLLRAAIAAKPLSSLSNARWCLITGPNLSASVAGELGQLADPDTVIYPHRADFRALLAHAKLSISQAGYNTTADILRAGCRAVLVPFATDGETEQTVRAHKLAERGLAGVINATELTPDVLSRVIAEQLRSSGSKPAHGIDLQGASATARIVLDAATER